jgi:hypothetical protein
MKRLSKREEEKNQRRRWHIQASQHKECEERRLEPTVTRKEVGEPSMKASGSSQLVRIDVNESAKKGRERAAPTYKLTSDIE